MIMIFFVGAHPLLKSQVSFFPIFTSKKTVRHREICIATVGNQDSILFFLILFQRFACFLFVYFYFTFFALSFSFFVHNQHLHHHLTRKNEAKALFCIRISFLPPFLLIIVICTCRSLVGGFV